MKNLLLLMVFILCIGAYFTQEERNIEGLVIDELNAPLIGANVLVKGTQLGTITDIDGKFKIKVPDGKTVLEVSYTGYQTEEVSIENKSKIIVTLKQSTQLLEEVVVVGMKRPLISRDMSAASSIVYADGLSENKVSSKFKNKPSVQNRRLQGLLGVTTGTSSNQKGENRSEYELTTDRESYSSIDENEFVKASEENTSTFGIDVDRASYSNIRRFINNSQLPPPDAIRIEEMVNYFEYSYKGPNNKSPFAVHSTVTECPWNEEHQILHIALQGKRIQTAKLPASNLVFLIDVSGSMSSSNKLPLVKSSFELLTNNLRDEDRVAIVVYAGAAGLVLPSTKGTRKKEILEAINKLQSGGSTAGGAGIQLAYNIASKNYIQGGNNRVILATDGDFNVGISADDELVKLIETKKNSGIFLSVLGFGIGNYQDGKMQKLADKGNGNHSYIDNLNEAKKVFVQEFGANLFTIAKDVKIQIEFDKSRVESYRLIGYENRMLENQDFDDDLKDAGELGAGHTVTALYEIVPVKQQTEKLAEIRLRYKTPEGSISTKESFTISGQPASLKSINKDLQFAIAVAEFGLALKNSKYKGSANFPHSKSLAIASKDKDAQGYRQEFIEMVTDVIQLKSSLASTK